MCKADVGKLEHGLQDKSFKGLRGSKGLKGFEVCWTLYLHPLIFKTFELQIGRL